MSFYTGIICDECGVRDEAIEGRIGGQMSRHRWITLSRSISQSGDRVGAGTLNFCSDKCLCSFVNVNSKAKAK